MNDDKPKPHNHTTIQPYRKMKFCTLTNIDMRYLIMKLLKDVDTFIINYSWMMTCPGRKMEFCILSLICLLVTFTFVNYLCKDEFLSICY